MKKQPIVWDINSDGILKDYDGRLLQVDPLETKKAGETVYVKPGKNTVHIAPPKVGDKELARWNFETESWEKVESHIGEVWYDQDGQEVIINEIGPVPNDLLESPPKKPAPPKPTTAEKKAALIYTLQKRALRKEMERIAAENVQPELTRISKLSLTKLQEEYDNE